MLVDIIDWDKKEVGEPILIYPHTIDEVTQLMDNSIEVLDFLVHGHSIESSPADYQELYICLSPRSERQFYYITVQ